MRIDLHLNTPETTRHLTLGGLIAAALLLTAFVQILHGAVQQGQDRRMSAERVASALLPCQRTPGHLEREACVSRMAGKQQAPAEASLRTGAMAWASAGPDNRR